MRKVVSSSQTAGVTMRRLRRDGVDRVQVTDHDKRLVYVLAVTEFDGLPELTRYEVRTVHDLAPLPVPPHDDYLPQAWLASSALNFLRDGSLPGSRTRLATEGGTQIAFRGKRPRTHTGAERVKRPDDERLVQFLEEKVRQQRRQRIGERRISLRQELVRAYGIQPSTADGWIRRARDLAPDLIPKNTGRPRKTARGEQAS